MFKTRLRPTILLVGLLLVASSALANPLLDPDFWPTATPATLHEAVRGGADVNARDQHGATPLHHAAALTTNPEVIHALVELGADVNERDQDGLTPLHFAVRYNINSEVVLALLELGADHRARTGDGHSAWDLIQENEPLQNTPAFWRLNDLRF